LDRLGSQYLRPDDVPGQYEPPRRYRCRTEPLPWAPGGWYGDRVG
jgi:hypothetical protein